MKVVIFSDSFPEEDWIVEHKLSLEEKNLPSMAGSLVLSCSFIPRRRGKDLARILAKNFTKNKKLDFSGVSIIVDSDNADNETLAVLEKLKTVNLTVVNDGHPPFTKGLNDVEKSDGNTVWQGDEEALTYWIENASFPEQLTESDQVESQLDDLLGDLGLDDEEDFSSNDTVEDTKSNEVDPIEKEASSSREEAVAMSHASHHAKSAHSANENVLEDDSDVADNAGNDEDDELFDPNVVFSEDSDKNVFDNEEDTDHVEESVNTTDHVDEVDEIEPIQVSQEDLFADREAESTLRSDQRNAYIDGTLDNDDPDYGSNGGRRAEPEMVGNPTAPAFLERARKKENDTREAVNRLSPDPVNFDNNIEDQAVGAEELMRNDGGFPKEEASLEAKGSQTHTNTGSLSEGDDHEKTESVVKKESDHIDSIINGEIDDDLDDFVPEKAEDPFNNTSKIVEKESVKQHEDLTDSFPVVEERREDEDVKPIKIPKIEISSARNESYEYSRSTRHEDTRVIGFTGPAGGSGKTTTAYSAFLASSSIDRYYGNTRSNQYTWLIEMDYSNPKWKQRASIADEDSMVKIIDTVNRMNGNVHGKDLIELAKRHAVYPIVHSGGDSNRNHKAIVLVAPKLTDYEKKGITIEQYHMVINRLVEAIVKDKTTPSTVIFDLPDYSGESIDQNLSDVVNRYCDSISICYPESGDPADLNTIIALIDQQSKHQVSTSRIAVVATRQNKYEALSVKNMVQDMQINYAGWIPKLPELEKTRTDLDDPNARRDWIATASSKTKNYAAISAAGVLYRANINRLGEDWQKRQVKALKSAPQQKKRPAPNSGKARQPVAKTKKREKRNFIQRALGLK